MLIPPIAAAVELSSAMSVGSGGRVAAVSCGTKTDWLIVQTRFSSGSLCRWLRLLGIVSKECSKSCGSFATGMSAGMKDTGGVLREGIDARNAGTYCRTLSWNVGIATLELV
jgi:hypothetical protein